MSSTSSTAQTPGASSNSGGLATSDIIGIAIGVPSGVLALVGIIFSYCAWQYPATPIGRVGNTILQQFSVRGGDARGGDAQGSGAHGGNATGENAIGGNAVGGNAVGGYASVGQIRGGTGLGGDATGRNARGGRSFGGQASMV